VPDSLHVVCIYHSHQAYYVCGGGVEGWLTGSGTLCAKSVVAEAALWFGTSAATHGSAVRGG
jgi:hypothetical protein